MRVFLAGASGAIGKSLSRILVADGHEVTGTTRSPVKAGRLAELGVTPLIVDVYDVEVLTAAVKAARPDIVIHQLTDLPPALDPARMAEARIANTRLRDIGTRNLVAAAQESGVGAMIAQSIAFAYAQGEPPYSERDPLDPQQAGAISLEAQVLAMPRGVVLRYGKLYGPGTGFDAPDSAPAVHVDAAADAARRAITHGEGIYNVAEAGGSVDVRRIKADLGWSSDFRIG